MSFNNNNDEVGKVYDRLGNIYDRMLELMGAINDGYSFTTEELIGALGDISKMVLNAKEHYIDANLNGEPYLLDSVSSQRSALDQALNAMRDRGRQGR